MANIKQVKNNAISTIDAALAILNKFPPLDETNTSLSFNTSTNPFEFLMDLFKSTSGYNTLLNILSKFIAYELPAVEIAVKGVILSNLKNIISCSINPFISYDLLKNGIIFNLNQIDLTDTLYYSPLSNIGKYYYFGCDDYMIADDVKKSKDFNALLWYMKTRSIRREVWGRKKETEDYTKTKEDGIITLEYNEYSQSVKTSDGNDMYLKTPFNNTLHVFIGNVKENISNDIEDKYRNIQTQVINKYNELDGVNLLLNDEIIKLDKLQEQYLSQTITDNEYNHYNNEYQNNINYYKKQLKNLEQDCVNLSIKKNNVYNDMLSNVRKIQSNPNNYRAVEENYYYGKTLIEFNVDYISSIQLFDSKVVAAQLIDQLTSLLTIDLNLSYKQQLIRSEIKKMVKMIVETDDVVVSDCFFTFSNNDYDKMLEKSELVKNGLFTINGEENSINHIDASKLLETLNGINPSASQENIQTIIEGSLTEISKELSNTDYEIKDGINFGVQMNFIENLMNNLAYVIANSVLSPKVYLLLLINLELLGRNTNFDLEGFIGQFKQLITSILREIRDQLINYLITQLMIILGELAKEIAVRISVEQSLYYARLIKRLLDCIKRKGMRLDWTMDNVDYADIYNTEEEPKNNEC